MRASSANSSSKGFGQLIDGADVLDAIAAVPCGPGDKPVNDVVIDTIEVQE